MKDTQHIDLTYQQHANIDWSDGGARHFVERHFVYYDTSSKVFVELQIRRKVTSSNAFSSNTTLRQI